MLKSKFSLSYTHTHIHIHAHSPSHTHTCKVMTTVTLLDHWPKEGSHIPPHPASASLPSLCHHLPHSQSQLYTTPKSLKFGTVAGGEPLNVFKIHAVHHQLAILSELIDHFVSLFLSEVFAEEGVQLHEEVQGWGRDWGLGGARCWGGVGDSLTLLHHQMDLASIGDPNLPQRHFI